MRSSRTFVVFACGIAIVLVGSERAFAHDLRAKVSLESNPIRVEAWFDDDSPAEGATVAVANESGQTIASGKLDETGVWTFPKPEPGSYRIVVALTGHRDVVQLVIPPDAPAEAVESWRLDKDLGLAIGLGLLLGGTVAFVLLRRFRRRVSTEPLVEEVRENS